MDDLLSVLWDSINLLYGGQEHIKLELEIGKQGEDAHGLKQQADEENDPEKRNSFLVKYLGARIYHLCLEAYYQTFLGEQEESLELIEEAGEYYNLRNNLSAFYRKKET